MKKKYSIIFLGIILLSIFSCSNSKLGHETDLVKENLKGDVVFVKYETIVEPSIEFNEKGMVKRKIYFDPSIDVCMEAEYIYNEDSRIDKKIEYQKVNNSELVTHIAKYVYNSENQLVRIEQIKDDELISIEFQYQNGLIQQESENDKYFKTTKRYYYTDKALDSILCFKTYKNTNEITKEIDYFNKKGKISKTLITSHDGSILIKNYEYDPKSNLMSKSTIQRDNNEPKISNYSYDFDAKGNWIKLYTNNEIGQERVIYYKGDSYKNFVDKIDEYKQSKVSSRDKKTENITQPNFNDNSSSNTYQETERQKQQQPEKVKCYSCRGSGNCGKCSKTCSKPYYQGNGSYKWRNETKQGYTMCHDCFGRGHKQSHVVGGSGWEPNGDCYVRGCEDGWVNCRECNGSGNGTLLGKCRDCKGTGYRN
jgi:hypothetical protein